jgi:peroxiredoxin
VKARRCVASSAAACVAVFALASCNPAEEGPRAGAASGGPAGAVASGVDSFERVDFTLPDLNGTPRPLSEWDGDLVLLNFWATWCPPCKKEMPLFQDRFRSHAADGFTIVAVAVDELDETRAFVDSLGIEFPVLIGQEDAIAAAREYGNRIGALPYSVIIDRDGMVRETHRGEVTEADLDLWLQRHL